ncbi:radical SAM protein [Patescibacteria group bacterium]|nr:radical SAM protein [Patescibacteria group bacterium]
MIKVLLVYPPRLAGGRLEEDKLGLLYMAAFLRLNNVDVAVYDSQLEQNSFRELIRLLKRYKPDIIGVSVSTQIRSDAFKTAEIAKKINRNILVVAGGPHVTAAAIDTLKYIKAIDIGVVGEGEYTFLEICNSFANKTDFAKIKGIAFRGKEGVIVNPKRERINNLDTLPFPARDLLQKYNKKERDRYQSDIEMPDGTIIKVPNAAIITGRGCPFNCLFCAAPEIWGKVVKLRSLENVIAEIKHLREEFGVNSFRFCDDTLNVTKKRTLDLCNLIIKEKLDVKWQCNIRVDNVNREILRIMKEAGCYIVSMGVESGSQRVLENVIDKGITLEKVREVVRWCDEFGIKRNCNFMYSHPDETREDLKKTQEFMKELGGRQPFGPTIILPGSRIEKIAKEKNILPKDFSWAKMSPYKYYDPTSNSFVPIFVDKLSWQEILDIFYKHISTQSVTRTRNYIYHVIDRIFRCRSLAEAKIILWNYLVLLKVFIRNTFKLKKEGSNKR